MSIFILILINGAIGILLFEWAWSKTALVRQIDEARDSLFPAWRREDTKKWSRLRFYPGAMTIMPLRFVLMLLVLIATYPVLRLIFIGKDIRKKVSDTRRRLQQAWYAFAARSLLNIFFIVTVDTYKNQNFDYSYYLGPDYRKELSKEEIAPTLVSNHTSGFDICEILAHTRGRASFLASDHLENIPVVGYCIIACGGLFARRGASLEVRQACVDQIGEYQKEFEELGPLKNQLVVFAEGSTSNNKTILSFKRGAFSSLKPISPVLLEYSCPVVHVCNAVVKDIVLYILILCTFERIVCFRE